jgi:hypothetical protein
MKTEFKPGVLVRWNIPDGGLAEITNHQKTRDWDIPGYLGEGFYLVRTIPEGRELVGHEDDLILEQDARANESQSGLGLSIEQPGIGSSHPSFQNAEPKPTHYFDNSHGERYYGIYEQTRITGGNFYCICNDGETWTKEPVFVYGLVVREINPQEKGDEQ